MSMNTTYVNAGMIHSLLHKRSHDHLEPGLQADRFWRYLTNLAVTVDNYMVNEPVNSPVAAMLEIRDNLTFAYAVARQMTGDLFINQILGYGGICSHLHDPKWVESFMLSLHRCGIRHIYPLYWHDTDITANEITEDTLLAADRCVGFIVADGAEISTPFSSPEYQTALGYLAAAIGVKKICTYLEECTAFELSRISCPTIKTYETYRTRAVMKRKAFEKGKEAASWLQ